MVRSMRRAGRSFTWALALAIAVVSSATCVFGADMTEAQKACCAAMNHDCGDKGVEQDCCVSDSPDLPGLTSGPLVAALVPPALVALNTLPAEPEPTATLVGSSALDAGAPRPSSTPTYLFVSAFRL